MRQVIVIEVIRCCFVTAVGYSLASLVIDPAEVEPSARVIIFLVTLGVGMVLSALTIGAERAWRYSPVAKLERAVANLRDLGARHIKSGLLMNQASLDGAIDHALDELRELRETREHADAAAEFADLVGIVIHMRQMLGCSWDEVCDLAVEKFQQRFAIGGRPVTKRDLEDQYHG